MSGLALLALAYSLAPQPAALAPGNAAVEIFRQACTQGILKLSKDEGRILKASELVDFVDVIDWNRVTAEHTVVKLTHPRSTYLIYAQYRDVQPNGISKVCVLVSRAMTKQQAAAALLEGSPDVEPKITWWPNMYFPEWTIDLPKLGHRKRMRFRNDGSILLEVAMYGASLDNQTPLETKK